jgi:hypothetical protein
MSAGEKQTSNSRSRTAGVPKFLRGSATPRIADMNDGCHSAINNLRSAICNVHRGSRSMGTMVGDEPA